MYECMWINEKCVGVWIYLFCCVSVLFFYVFISNLKVGFVKECHFARFKCNYYNTSTHWNFRNYKHIFTSFYLLYERTFIFFLMEMYFFNVRRKATFLLDFSLNLFYVSLCGIHSHNLIALHIFHKHFTSTIFKLFPLWTTKLQIFIKLSNNRVHKYCFTQRILKILSYTHDLHVLLNFPSLSCSTSSTIFYSLHLASYHTLLKQWPRQFHAIYV